MPDWWNPLSWFQSAGQQTFQNITTPVSPTPGTIGASVTTAQQATRPQVAIQQSAPSPTITVPIPEHIHAAVAQELPISGIASFLKSSAETVSSRLSDIFRPIIETPQAQAVIKAVTTTAVPAQTSQTVSDMSQFSRDIYGGASRVAAVIGSGMGIADIGARRIERQLPGGLSELYGTTYELGKGIFLSAPRATVETVGMIPGGVETIARHVPMLPAFAAAGIISQVSGLQEGFTQRPFQTIGELVGMGAMGEAGKVVRFGEVKIPTTAGEVPVWKGAYLDIGTTPRPLIGYAPEFIAKPISEPVAIGFHPEAAITRAIETARTSKPVIGMPSTTEIPQITDITAGYFPKSALETAMVARPEILTKLGMEPTAATKISVGRELIELTSGQKTAFQLTRPYSFEIFGKEIVTPFQIPTIIKETSSLSEAGVLTTLEYLKSEKFKLTDVPKVEELTALDRLTEINKEILKESTPLEGKYSFKSTMELEPSPGKKVYPTEIKPLIEKVMGSFSAQSQMMPEFRRVAGDIDIHTYGTTEQAVQLATGLQAKLAEIGIETRVSGSTVETRGISKEWVHAVQFLPKEELSYVGSEGAGLRYGIRVEQPPITVEGMPVMKLGEQATRKITGSLEFREGKLVPAEHRLLKDVRDAYTTAFTLIESKATRIGVPILKDIEVARGRQLLQQWKELYPEVDWMKVGQEPVKMEISVAGIDKIKEKSLMSEINKYAERFLDQTPYTLGIGYEAANTPYIPSTYRRAASFYSREFTPFTEEYPTRAEPTRYQPTIAYVKDYPTIKEPLYTFPLPDVPTYKPTEYPPSKVPSYPSGFYPPTSIPAYPTLYTPEKVPPYIPPYIVEKYPTTYPYTPTEIVEIDTFIDMTKIKKLPATDIRMGKRKKKITRKSAAYTIKNPLADLEDVLGVVDTDIRKEINPSKKKRKSK